MGIVSWLQTTNTKLSAWLSQAMEAGVTLYVMARKKKQYDYTIELFSQVDTYLSEDVPDQKLLPLVLVSFCTVSEKVLKMHLYKKNKALPYDISKFKDSDQLVMIATGKEKGQIETIQHEEAVQRFRVTHRKSFTDEEIEIIRDLYKLRNCFVHSHKADNDIDYDAEDIIKKMGTLWSTVSKLATSALGKTVIKSSIPKKTYSEEELRSVLREEVRKKVNQKSKHLDDWGKHETGHSWSSLEPSCPRCGSKKFRKQDDGSTPWEPMNPAAVTFTSVIEGPFIVTGRHSDSDIYKCNKCGLELTEKEYEIYRSDLSIGGYSNN